MSTVISVVTSREPLQLDVPVTAHVSFPRKAAKRNNNEITTIKTLISHNKARDENYKKVVAASGKWPAIIRSSANTHRGVSAKSAGVGRQLEGLVER